MTNELTFSFFNKKQNTLGKGVSGWKIVPHPYKSDKALKFIIVSSSMLRSNILKRIEREYKFNKMLMKKKGLRAVMVPSMVGKIENHGSDSHLLHYVYFIEMEKMDGDLTKIKGKNIDWENIILQVLAGLVSLHKLGIKHGDLAPRNILFKRIKEEYKFKVRFRGKTKEILVKDYEIKISDFGMSKTTKSKLVSHEDFKNDLAYLSSSLVFNSNHRVKLKKQFKIPSKVKKSLTGFKTLSKKKIKQKNNIYKFLRKKISTQNILNRF